MATAPSFRGPIELPQAGVPARSARTVQVVVPGNVYNNLEAMSRVTATLLGRLGCPGCHSGIDIRFIQEENYQVDEKLNVTPITAGF